MLPLQKNESYRNFMTRCRHHDSMKTLAIKLRKVSRHKKSLYQIRKDICEDMWLADREYTKLQ